MIEGTVLNLIPEHVPCSNVDGWCVSGTCHYLCRICNL